MKKLICLLLCATTICCFFSSCSTVTISDAKSLDLSTVYKVDSECSFSVVSVKTSKTISPSFDENQLSCPDEDCTLIDVKLDVKNLSNDKVKVNDIFYSVAKSSGNEKYEATNFSEITDFKSLSSEELLNSNGENYYVHLVFEVPDKRDNYLITIKNKTKRMLSFKYNFGDVIENSDKKVVADDLLKIGNGLGALQIVKSNKNYFDDNYYNFCYGCAYLQNGVFGDAITCFKKCSNDYSLAKSKKQKTVEKLAQYNGTYRYQYRARRYSYIYINNGYACISSSKLNKDDRNYDWQIAEYENKMYIAKRGTNVNGLKDKNLVFQITFNTDNVGNELRVVVVGDKSTLMYNGSFEKV